MDKRDFYEVLGVSRGAGEADIKKSYRRLAKQYHPDHNKGDKDAETKFKEVQEAYDTLTDKEKRQRYDQFGHAGVDPRFQGAGGPQAWSSTDGVPIDFENLGDIFDFAFTRGGGGQGSGSVFERFFQNRGGGGEASRTAGPPVQDIEHAVTLGFEQAIRGATLELQLSGGRGQEKISVKIPPGVREGQRIRIKGKGEGGRRGSGDLYVVCNIQPHAYFRRVVDDIYLEAPLTITEAALGAKIDLPTLDGVRTVTIPPGTASGSRLRLAGLGVANPKTGERGDQFVVIKIVPPAKPTTEQEALVERAGCDNCGFAARRVVVVMIHAEHDQSRDRKGAPRGIRSILHRSLTVAALIIALLPSLNHRAIAKDQPIAAQFDGAASQPTTSPSETQQLVRWRLTFFWSIVLVLIFFIAALVIIRFSLRYRAYLFREKNPPTPSEDVWRMHRLPEDEDSRGPGAEGPRD